MDVNKSHFHPHSSKQRLQRATSPHQLSTMQPSRNNTDTITLHLHFEAEQDAQLYSELPTHEQHLFIPNTVRPRSMRPIVTTNPPNTPPTSNTRVPTNPEKQVTQTRVYGPRRLPYNEAFPSNNQPSTSKPAPKTTSIVQVDDESPVNIENARTFPLSFIGCNSPCAHSPSSTFPNQPPEPARLILSASEGQ